MSLGEVGGVAVDSRDHVYVFNRGRDPMIVFDREGRFITSWGHGRFKRPHGIHIGPDDSVYCTDEGSHMASKFTPEGHLLLEVGTPSAPAPFMSGRPFHRCTHTALSPGGNIYVSDGYGNASVHVFSPEGRHLHTWGGPGTDPGQFNLPHNIVCDDDGWVYVADRENHRVQVFDGTGRYETQWNNLHRPCALCMGKEADPVFYVGEIGPSLPVNREYPNIGPRISIVNRTGTLLARYGHERPGTGENQFIAPHGMAVDSRGDLYVGEVSHTAWNQLYPGTDMPAELRVFRKLERVASGHAGSRATRPGVNKTQEELT
jgi:hypothetical protein